MTLRVAERKLGDPGRRPLGDDFQALDNARHDLVLEARVEVLGVLAHDDEIDPLAPGRHAGQVPHRPQVRVQIERLAQPDVDAREALPDRRADRALERDLVAPDGCKELGRQRLARTLEGGDACQLPFPGNRDTGRVDDAQDRLGHLRSDAVAGDQRDGMGHSG